MRTSYPWKLGLVSLLERGEENPCAIWGGYCGGETETLEEASRNQGGEYLYPRCDGFVQLSLGCGNHQ